MITAFRRAIRAFRAPPVDSSWRRWNVAHRLRAALEAAMPRDDLWTLADFKDADASLKPHVRRVVRSRTRYEYANNPLVQRVVDVWTGDVVGECGPALQVNSGCAIVDRFIERAWDKWWRVSHQAEKLRTAVRTEAVDGEAVAVLTTNKRLGRRQPVEVDAVLVEADRLASPDWSDSIRSDYVDGVHLDPETREPLAYDILRAHPGTEYLDKYSEMWDHDEYPRERVLHAFRRSRPEQHRGVSRYAPALPLSGLHRKYLEAETNRNVLRAAFAFVIKSMAPPDAGEEGGVGEDQWWQEIKLPNRSGAGMFLPDQYDVTQLRPDGSAGELSAFHQIMGGVISGCFTMPVGRALGVYTNSSYPGVRAEMQPYHRAISADRYQVWEPQWLEPIYESFIAELTTTNEWGDLWAAISGKVFGTAGVQVFTAPGRVEETPELIVDPEQLDLYEVEWNWPEKELVVDPSREEESRLKKMAMGLTDREREMALSSVDLEERDKRAAHMLGIDDVTVYRRMLAQSILGVAVPDAQPEAPPGEKISGEFGNLGRRQWQNNRKAIRDCLQDLIDGQATEAATLQMLETLGLSEARAQVLIEDARDSHIDDPELQDSGSDPPLEPAGPGIAAAWPLNANCGTGKGGFQPGNDCAERKGISAKSEKRLAQLGRFQKRLDALKRGELRTKGGEPIARDERMTEFQQVAVYEYSERSTMVNEYLRGQKPFGKTARRSLDARAEAIDTGLSNLPERPGITMRGQSRKHLESLQVGDAYTEPAFLSTTTNPEHPALIRGPDRAIIEVVGRTGRSIRHTQHDPTEEEVLFRRKTPFRVTERREEPDGTLYLKFEEG